MAGFQPGSCVPVAQNSSRAEANAATVCLPPLFALPTSQRTGARDPDQCGSRGLSEIPSTTRAVRHQVPRAHAVLHPANSDREYDQGPGFQCLIVTNTDGHGLRKLDPLSTQAPSSCKHLFPFFESVLSNQEA